MPRPLPQHVWVRDGDLDQPGLLVSWQWQGAEWWGSVVLVVDGEPVLKLVRADLLRPASGSKRATGDGSAG